MAVPVQQPGQWAESCKRAEGNRPLQRYKETSKGFGQVQAGLLLLLIITVTSGQERVARGCGIYPLPPGERAGKVRGRYIGWVRQTEVEHARLPPGPQGKRASPWAESNHVGSLSVEIHCWQISCPRHREFPWNVEQLRFWLWGAGRSQELLRMTNYESRHSTV